jgi:hypothetical protein
MNSSQDASSAQPSKRTVQAPQADVAPGVALSVEVAEDEEVEWQWRHDPGGRSQITGYQIVKRPNTR